MSHPVIARPNTCATEPPSNRSARLPQSESRQFLTDRTVILSLALSGRLCRQPRCSTDCLSGFQVRAGAGPRSALRRRPLAIRGMGPTRRDPQKRPGRLPPQRWRRHNRELAGTSGGRMQDRPRAPALVGRDGELGELLAGLDDAASGSGRLFLLARGPWDWEEPPGLRGGGPGPGSRVQGGMGAVLGGRRGACVLAVGAVAAGLRSRA